MNQHSPSTLSIYLWFKKGKSGMEQEDLSWWPWFDCKDSIYGREYWWRMVTLTTDICFNLIHTPPSLYYTTRSFIWYHWEKLNNGCYMHIISLYCSLTRLCLGAHPSPPNSGRLSVPVLAPSASPTNIDNKIFLRGACEKNRSGYCSKRR